MVTRSWGNPRSSQGFAARRRQFVGRARCFAIPGRPRQGDRIPAGSEALLSSAWILRGTPELIIPHLKAVAMVMHWDETPFHVRGVDPADSDLAELLLIQPGDATAGAFDFMPLPADRTLMRLYLSSDLGLGSATEASTR